MAIYHLSAQIIGRSAGRSAVAAAAYRSTTRIVDRTTGETFDFSRKSKALYSGMLLPKDAPEWAADRSEFWNRVQEKEKRKDAQFCRELNVALPEELKEYPLLFDQMIKEFCERNFTSFGFAVDYAIHKPDKKGDSRNYHAHIMVALRKFENKDWAEKKDRAGNTKEALQEIRESWEYQVNKMLTSDQKKVSCKSLKEQGVTDREPQQHMGVTATAIERKGRIARRTRYKKFETSRVQETVKTEPYKNTPRPVSTQPAQSSAIKFLPEKEISVRREKIRNEIDNYASNAAVKQMVPLIESESEKWKARRDENPKQDIQKKPMFSFFYKWIDSRGIQHKNYNDYSKAQNYINEKNQEAQNEIYLIRNFIKCAKNNTPHLIESYKYRNEFERKRTANNSVLTKGNKEYQELIEMANEIKQQRAREQTKTVEPKSRSR